MYLWAWSWVCVFAFGTERRDQVLIKSNRVDLSSGCNQLPQCALSSPANGCFVVCYVDWYTHTSLEKWISGIKEPLLSSPMHPPIFLWCKWPIRYIYDTVEQICQAIPQDIWGSDIWRHYSWICWTVQSPAAIFLLLFSRCYTAVSLALTCTPNRATTSSACQICPLTMT